MKIYVPCKKEKFHFLVHEEVEYYHINFRVNGSNYIFDVSTLEGLWVLTRGSKTGSIIVPNTMQFKVNKVVHNIDLVELIIPRQKYINGIINQGIIRVKKDIFEKEVVKV